MPKRRVRKHTEVLVEAESHRLTNPTDKECRAMVQAVSHQAVQWFRRSVAGHLPLRHAFNPRPVYVGFAVDRVSMGRVCTPLSVSIIPPTLQTHSSTTLRKFSAARVCK